MKFSDRAVYTPCPLSMFCRAVLRSEKMILMNSIIHHPWEVTNVVGNWAASRTLEEAKESEQKKLLP